MSFLSLQELHKLRCTPKMIEFCKIQSNNFTGAHIGGSVTEDDSHSGENFCGNAGDTMCGSKYSNSSSSSADSSANSSSNSQDGEGGEHGGSSGSSGNNAAQRALANTKQHSSGGQGSTSSSKKACGPGWNQTKCSMLVILL